MFTETFFLLVFLVLNATIAQAERQWPLLQAIRPAGLQQVPNNQKTTLPQYDSDPVARALAIIEKRSGFLYGSPKMGNGSFFPTGTLGSAMVKRDLEQFNADEDVLFDALDADAADVQRAIEAVSEGIICVGYPG